jgi:hypothetical protein
MGRNITPAAVLLRGIAAMLVAIGTLPPPIPALAAPAPPAAVENFSVEQLDALLAPIALYPDPLLAQVLMASAHPVQIVQAQRWLDDPARKSLSGDALEQALQAENWDPSVKSLIPFPQMLAMMSAQLDWTQQLGYAMSTQEVDVMGSVQRLRLQAQSSGTLASTPQQIVTNDGPMVIIQPAEPAMVYVPVYDPSVVYGAWPYPSYPPVYFPPPPGYVVGPALAFGVGVAIAAGLWNVGYPNWRYGNVNVNVNRWNTINVNRPPVNSPAWRPSATTLPVRVSGPVGRPGGAAGLPANAVGRPAVKVPSGAVNRPTQPPTQLPARPAGTPTARPSPAERPAQLPARANTPAARPTPTIPQAQNRSGSFSSGAFNGISEGQRAGQYAVRGSQSVQSRQPVSAPAGGGGTRNVGGAARGGSPGVRR